MTSAPKPTHTVSERFEANVAEIILAMADRAGFNIAKGEVAGELMLACCCFAVRRDLMSKLAPS